MSIITLCPHCKAVCSVPDAAVGKQVACRCESVFCRTVLAAEKPELGYPCIGMGAAGHFSFSGLGGTLALVAASIVFAFYRQSLCTEKLHLAKCAAEAGGFIPCGIDPSRTRPFLPKKVVLPPLDLLPSPA